MLGERTIRTVSDVVRYSARFKAMLFEWDSERCRLTVTRSWRQKTYFTIIALYLTAEAVYQARTIHAESQVRTISVQSYLKLVTHFSTRLAGLMLAVTNGCNAKNIATFFNQMLDMNRRCRVYFRREKIKDRSNGLLWFFKYFVYLQPLMPALTYVSEYTDKRYWQGAVLPGFVLPFIRPCFFVVEYWISLYVMLGIVFWGYMICPYLFCNLAWATALCWKQSVVHVNKWRQIHTSKSSCNLYKGLQILNQAFNAYFEETMAFCLAACMVCLVLTLTGTIELTPQMQFPGYLIFPVGVLALLQAPCCAFTPAVEVTGSSTAFIQCYRSATNSLQFKIARSLMPLTIRVSIFYEMSHSTVLEFYSKVVQNTVSVLLI